MKSKSKSLPEGSDRDPIDRSGEDAEDVLLWTIYSNLTGNKETHVATEERFQRVPTEQIDSSSQIKVQHPIRLSDSMRNYSLYIYSK